MSGHTSGDDKKKGSGLILGCLVLGAFLTIAIGLRKIPDLVDSKESVEVSSPGIRESGNYGNSVRVEQPVDPYVRKPLVAPAGTYEGATWFDVPSGYHPMICEADENLVCTSTETDITAVRFELQCKDLRGNLLDWDTKADLIGCHARAKGDTPLHLAAWLEPL